MTIRALALVIVAACSGRGAAGSDSHVGDDAAGPDALTDAPAVGFSWQMAGAVVLWNDPLTASPATLVANHFSAWAVRDEHVRERCAANGCNYVGNPARAKSRRRTSARGLVKTYQQQGPTRARGSRQTSRRRRRTAWQRSPIRPTTAPRSISIVDAEKSRDAQGGHANASLPRRCARIPARESRSTRGHIDIDFSYWVAHGYAISRRRTGMPTAST
jgi:hypothetical protein